MLDALYQSVAIFFITYGAYYNSDVGVWECGTTLMTSTLCVMLLHQAVETKSWVISSCFLKVFEAVITDLKFNLRNYVWNSRQKTKV